MDKSGLGKGRAGFRSTAVATGAGHVLVETFRTELARDVSSLRVRDLRTGRPVGPELPQPPQHTAVVDTADNVAVVFEKPEGGATTGPYGLDLTTGKVLWRRGKDQSAKAEIAGGGLAWLQGADGFVAVNDRTGTPRARGLRAYPLLALPGMQVTDGDHGLQAGPLLG